MKGECVSCGDSIPETKKHHKKYGNYCKECSMEARDPSVPNEGAY